MRIIEIAAECKLCTQKEHHNSRSLLVQAKASQEVPLRGGAASPLISRARSSALARLKVVGTEVRACENLRLAWRLNGSGADAKHANVGIVPRSPTIIQRVACHVHHGWVIGHVVARVYAGRWEHRRCSPTQP